MRLVTYNYKSHSQTNSSLGMRLNTWRCEYSDTHTWTAVNGYTTLTLHSTVETRLLVAGPTHWQGTPTLPLVLLLYLNRLTLAFILQLWTYSFGELQCTMSCIQLLVFSVVFTWMPRHVSWYHGCMKHITHLFPYCYSCLQHWWQYRLMIFPRTWYSR